MAEKNKETASSRHYTVIEKETFLELLVEYKAVIENKKSDGSTLKAKEDTWKNITQRFNSSLHISTQRTTKQLKKYWANLKQHQRDAKTKENQARMGTGGGPEPTPADLDPMIELINPHLMQRAPCGFSSNLTQGDLERNVDLVNQGAEVLLIGPDRSLLVPADPPLVHEDGGNVTQACDINNELSINNEGEISSSPDLIIGSSSEESPDTHPLATSVSLSELVQNKQNAPSTSLRNSRKGKRTTLSSSSSSSDNSVCPTEQYLKAERIKKITLIEERIYQAKLDFELECIEQKRQHLKRKLQIEENIALAEERAATAKACLVELELEAARKKHLS